MKIGIAGFGFVGQAVYGSLRRPSEAVIYDPHMAVGMDGYRGYGGACFPKDVGAIHNARPHMLTEFMRAYNARLLDATYASRHNVGGVEVEDE